METFPIRYFERQENISTEKKFGKPLKGLSKAHSISALSVFINFQYGDLTIDVYNGSISILNLIGSGGSKSFVDVTGRVQRPNLCPKTTACPLIISFIKDGFSVGPEEIENEIYDTCKDATCIFCVDAYHAYQCSTGATSLMIGVIWVVISFATFFILIVLVLLTYKLSVKLIGCIPSFRRVNIVHETESFIPMEETVDDDERKVDFDSIVLRSSVPVPDGDVKTTLIRDLNIGDYVIGNNRLIAGTGKVERKVFSPTPRELKLRNGFWTIVLLMLMLPLVLCCDNVFSIAGEEEICYEYSQNQTCYISKMMSMTMPGVGSTSCLNLYTHDGSLAMRVTIKLTEYYQLFTFGFSYYTSDYFTRFVNDRWCPSDAFGKIPCRFDKCNAKLACWPIYEKMEPPRAGAIYCYETNYACSVWTTAGSGALIGAKTIFSPIGPMHSVYELQSSYFQPVYEITISDQSGTSSSILNLAPSEVYVEKGIEISRGAESPGVLYNMERSWLTDGTNTYLCPASALNDPTKGMIGDYQSDKPYIRTKALFEDNMADNYYFGYDDARMSSPPGQAWLYDSWATGLSKKASQCQDTSSTFTEGPFSFSQLGVGKLIARSGVSAPLTLNMKTSIEYVTKHIQEDKTLTSLECQCSGTSGLYGTIKMIINCESSYKTQVVSVRLQETTWTDIGYVNCSGVENSIYLLGMSEVSNFKIQASNLMSECMCLTPFLSKVDNDTFLVVVPTGTYHEVDGEGFFDFFNWFSTLPDWLSNILSIGASILVLVLIVFAIYMFAKILCCAGQKFSRLTDPPKEV